MNINQLKDILEKYTSTYNDDEYGIEVDIDYDNIILEIGQIIQDETFERISDELWSSLQSDFEHGVKSLNENAAKEFYTKYPNLKDFIQWMDMQHTYS